MSSATGGHSEQGTELSDAEIEGFRQRYLLEMARYERAAQVVADRLRRELRAEARLRHIISFRAKHPDDLREKLARKRSAYANARATLEANINDVVTDLAGVRVVVYVPEDEERVVSIVDRTFAHALRSDAALPPYRKESGYRATHRLVLASGDGDDIALQNAVCEVQVTTLASHLFNELEHDITYKTHGVEPSSEDTTCLRHARSLTEILDREVTSLFEQRRQLARRAERIDSPENLRFALEASAHRPLAGDFKRLFQMLNASLNVLSGEALEALGSFGEVTERGKKLASTLDLPDPDDVIEFVLGLDQLHPEFQAYSLSWRGPRTPLRRALAQLAARTSGQDEPEC